MFGRVLRSILSFFLQLFGKKGAGWRLQGEVFAEPDGFRLRVTHEVPAAAKGKLYLRVKDAGAEGEFLTMEPVSPGEGETILPVSSIDVPGGRRYSLDITDGDGIQVPSSPAASVEVPSYPQITEVI